MSGVVKFSEASSIALHAMAILAGHADGYVSIQDIAARLPVSGHHLAKVLQRLARAGLVRSVRGPRGGFALRGDPAEVTLLQVHEAIEGPIEASPCLFSPAQCRGDCLLGELPRETNLFVRRRLSRIRLADAARILAGRPADDPGGGAPRRPRRAPTRRRGAG